MSDAPSEYEMIVYYTDGTQETFIRNIFQIKGVPTTKPVRRVETNIGGTHFTPVWDIAWSDADKTS